MPCRVLAALLLAASAFFGGLHGVARSASAGPNLLISTDRTEPDIAIDPADPSTIVIGANPNYDWPVGGAYPDAVFVSHDGGKSFAAGTLPLPAGYVDAADPSVAIARSGTIFFAYLAESPAYCSQTGRSAILLSSSLDGGRTFRSPTIINISSANDKPFMRLENVPGRRAHVFVTWTQFIGNSSRVLEARSLDGGYTFGRTHVMYGSDWDNSGSVPLIGLGGRVYVMWASVADNGISKTNPARVLFRRSDDDGAHFGPLRQAGPQFTSIPRMTEPFSLRNLTWPGAAIAPNGTLFVAWTQVDQNYSASSVSSDIVLTRSTDGGKTWAGPHRVNDSRVRDRFMPAMTAYPDGSVGIAFYDRREGWWDLGVYAARVSWDRSFRVSRNVRLSGNTSPVGGILYIRPGSTCLSPGRFFGDYIGDSVGPNDRLFVAWADSQRRAPGQTDVWVSSVSLPRP